MDDYELAVLVEDVASARLRLDALWLQNTAGLDSTERLKGEIAYRMAYEKWLAAELALIRATSAKPPRS